MATRWIGQRFIHGTESTAGGLAPPRPDRSQGHDLALCLWRLLPFLGRVTLVPAGGGGQEAQVSQVPLLV